MGLESVVPGKYTATVIDRGVREVERLNGALEAWAKLEFNGVTIEWKGLCLTVAGARNVKTFKCLSALACDGDLLKWLELPVTEDRVSITIIDQPSKSGDKIYKTVDWINDLADPKARSSSASVVDKIKALGLGSANVGEGDVDPEFGF